jgi:hypothetical protein
MVRAVLNVEDYRGRAGPGGFKELELGTCGRVTVDDYS